MGLKWLGEWSCTVNIWVWLSATDTNDFIWVSIQKNRNWKKSEILFKWLHIEAYVGSDAHCPWRLLLLIFWFPEHHYRNNLPFICIISEVIISLTCRIIFVVIFVFNQWEAQNSTWNVSQNIIQYHTQIYRELKVFLIPCKQLHLSLSRLLGTNPTNGAKTTRRAMTLWTTQDKDVLIQVCSACPCKNQHVPFKYKVQLLFLVHFSLSLQHEVKWLKKTEKEKKGLCDTNAC